MVQKIRSAPMVDVEIPMYANARVQSISPFMFVFDASKYKLKNKESWDSCIKIYKRFDTLDNIKANKLYKLTQEQIDDLKQLKTENEANDSDGSSKEVTNYTVTDGNNLTVGKTSVTISYTENGVTKTVTQSITVKEAHNNHQEDNHNEEPHGLFKG